MADISKISPDDGSTILNIKDSNAVHWGDQSKGYVGKNLFPQLKPYILTGNGITLSINDDNTITVNGTATATIFFTLFYQIESTHDGVLFEQGDYKFTGCPTGGSNDNYYMRIQKEDNTYHLDEYGNGVTITCDGISYYKIYIVIKSGYVANNLVFKPMVTYANVPDSDYAHYEARVIRNTELMTYENNKYIGAKNLLRFPYDVTSKTVNGITFTINDDGTITANGTSTDDIWYELHNKDKADIFPTKGLYRFSGGKLDNQKWMYIQWRNAADTEWITPADINKTYGDIIINRNSDVKYCVIIRVAKNVTLDNFVFYPMIRYEFDYDNTYATYAMTNKDLTSWASNQYIYNPNHPVTGWNSNDVKDACKYLYDYMKENGVYVATVYDDSFEYLVYRMFARLGILAYNNALTERREVRYERATDTAIVCRTAITPN